MFRLMNGQFANIEKVPSAVLDHEIHVMESRANQWARVWKESPLKYLGPRYAEMVIEREFRDV